MPGMARQQFNVWYLFAVNEPAIRSVVFPVRESINILSHYTRSPAWEMRIPASIACVRSVRSVAGDYRAGTILYARSQPEPRRGEETVDTASVNAYT